MPLVIIAVVAVAVAILVYFAYFSGNKTELDDLGPKISDVKEETSDVAAVLKGKSPAAGGRGGRNLAYLAVFDCEDGEEREFFVSRQIFEEIEIGERDTLVYSGNIFLGFGGHGADEAVMDENGEAYGDDFSYDDFDESIDVEQSMVLPGESGLNAGDAAYFKQFRQKAKLPAKTETVEDETDSLTGYQARELLKKTTLYPFLKWESEVHALFERTYRDALTDMRGYDSPARKGMAADSVFINKNEIRAVITTEENPPLKSKITAEFGVND